MRTVINPPSRRNPWAGQVMFISVSNTSFVATTVRSSRLYCRPRALWKLNWFLRDFGYDTELLGRDEVDERQLIGLRGIVKVSRVEFSGAAMLRFDGFASASRWEELSPANLDN